MWLRIVKMFLNKHSFECFIIWWTIRSLLILPLRSIVLISFKKKITPLWSRCSYIIDIYVSSTQQNIAKFFENESVITWYKTGRISQKFCSIARKQKNATLSFFDNFTQEARYALWSRGNSNFRWLFPVDHIQIISAGLSLSNDYFTPIMIGKYTDIVCLFPLKINSGIVVQTDKLYEKS